jgi:hypothetical protein
MAKACKGYVYAVWGKRDEAQGVWDDLDELDRSPNKDRSGLYLTPYGRAMICMGRRNRNGDIDRDGAIEWLEKARQAHSSWMIYLKVDPVFAPLRSDPRYIDLLRLMKLEP